MDKYAKCEMLPQGIHYWYKTKNDYGKNMYFFLQDKYPKEYGFSFWFPKKGDIVLVEVPFIFNLKSFFKKKACFAKGV